MTDNFKNSVEEFNQIIHQFSLETSVCCEKYHTWCESFKVKIQRHDDAAFNMSMLDLINIEPSEAELEQVKQNLISRQKQ